MEKLKTALTDSVRKAKVSQIAANIEAAVKSAEGTSKLPKVDKQVTAPLPALPLRPKLPPKKLPQTTPHEQTETKVVIYNFQLNLT